MHDRFADKHVTERKIGSGVWEYDYNGRTYEAVKIEGKNRYNVFDSYAKRVITGASRNSIPYHLVKVLPFSEDIYDRISELRAQLNDLVDDEAYRAFIVDNVFNSEEVPDTVQQHLDREWQEIKTRRIAEAAIERRRGIHGKPMTAVKVFLYKNEWKVAVGRYIMLDKLSNGTIVYVPEGSGVDPEQYIDELAAMRFPSYEKSENSHSSRRDWTDEWRRIREKLLQKDGTDNNWNTMTECNRDSLFEQGPVTSLLGWFPEYLSDERIDALAEKAKAEIRANIEEFIQKEALRYREMYQTADKA